MGVSEITAHDVEKSVTSLHNKLTSPMKDVLVNIARQLGVEFSMTLEKSASTTKKSVTTSKKTVTTYVESMLISASTIVPPMFFNFKRRPVEKSAITEKESLSVPNISVTLTEKLSTKRTSADDLR